MRKFFSIVGVLTLTIVSLIYTNKTIELTKNFDNVMTTIKEVSDDYYVEPIDGEVIENYFIPGVSGREVNQNKSYKNMKKFGSFNKNLLEYKEISPNNKLVDNIDKYIIGGNKNKNNVSLIFLIDDSSDIDSCLKILDEKKVSANFFVNISWINKNRNKLNELIEKNYVVGNINYQNSAFSFVDTLIKDLSKKRYGFCYLEEENDNDLKICSMNNDFTIKPSIIVKNNPLIKIKENVSNGSIISLNCNKQVIQELPLIINYLNGKGYKIVNLEDLLYE